MSVKSFVLGGIAGYVLGAKAGRERYEQIVKFSSGVWNSKPVRNSVTKAQDAATTAVDSVKSRVKHDDAGSDEIDVPAVDF
ncbi:MULTISPECIES: hypothetical protein [unclassified Actinobaculum]|uniref:hypothetical protein n=1 Tax=unclassified Actinobaculum TaxID=2609299 RepID=UPI000D5289D8|nr:MULTISPECIES: hypothetical protein [unclassified Actinobaculum]AWE41521.1 hypothetical protein DDD63_00625 [Actinobaculum sp. 313]RTE48046.1 hypothetical protein EKN07_11285 [Actinobaculum sp. 352]